MLLFLLMTIAGCPGTPNRATESWMGDDGAAAGAAWPGGLMVRAIRGEPVLRVRVIEDASQVQVGGASQVKVAGGRGVTDADTGRTYATPLTISRQGGKYLLASAGGVAVSFAAHSLAIQPVHGEELSVNGVGYPQRMVLTANSVDQFDAINYVGIERYLPGVLDREFYRSWHGEAFKAQAVAARSYAIAMSARSRQARHDLEATTVSQAYGGSAAHARAQWAVEQTRGQVLAWEGAVVPAYYSSCCGGTGQDAVRAIIGAPNIAPLQGQARGTWCSASPNFRWGPQSVNRQTLAARIAGWGKANHHPVAKLQGLRSLTVSQRNSAQRPTEFTLVDDRGQAYTLGPEEFRFAANFGVGQAGGGFLKSSHVSVRMAGDMVQFVGAGFGHGAGMCQWGSQGLATHGYDYLAILGFYYPGARVEKAY